MDEGHWWQALRYAERNPVRAGLALDAASWRWSSAAAHCGTAEAEACLKMSMSRERWSAARWRKFLEEGETESEMAALRRSTHKGRALGAADFIQTLEQNTQRCLTPRPRGRPRKPLADQDSRCWRSRR
jgi:putative transposase